MNVLFISLTRIDSVKVRGLYTDLIRKIRDKGNRVTVITAKEKRDWGKTTIVDHDEDNVRYVYAKTLNITKNNNYIEKGIGIVDAGIKYLKTIKKVKYEKYDLVICTTPCITFETIVSYIKKRDNARVVLLLKDMWPYDLVFDNVLKTTGLKGIAYKYLERIAVKLFDVSDLIGCMTPKNKEFLEAVYGHGQEIERAVIIPNSIEPIDLSITELKKMELRNKYGIPLKKTVFVYGGNLGTAQGPNFIIDAIQNAANNPNVFFLIIGNGTESNKIFSALCGNDNVMCLPALPHDEYEELAYACDVGLIFLNWNCHTPNSPSRILQYMEASLPVICATDDTTDIGSIVTDNGFGLACKSNDIDAFNDLICMFEDEKMRERMGRNSRLYLENEFSVEQTYNYIFEGIKERG